MCGKVEGDSVYNSTFSLLEAVGSFSRFHTSHIGILNDMLTATFMNSHLHVPNSDWFTIIIKKLKRKLSDSLKLKFFKLVYWGVEPKVHSALRPPIGLEGLFYFCS
jgi:hypothetical protein